MERSADRRDSRWTRQTRLGRRHEVESHPPPTRRVPPPDGARHRVPERCCGGPGDGRAGRRRRHCDRPARLRPGRGSGRDLLECDRFRLDRHRCRTAGPHHGRRYGLRAGRGLQRGGRHHPGSRSLQVERAWPARGVDRCGGGRGRPRRARPLLPGRAPPGWRPPTLRRWPRSPTGGPRPRASRTERSPPRTCSPNGPTTAGSPRSPSTGPRRWASGGRRRPPSPPIWRHGSAS